MRASRFIGAAAGIAALAVAFYAGLEFQKGEGVLSDLVAVAEDRMGPQFSPYYELQGWASYRTQDPEPIVNPTKLADIVGACTGATTAEVESCAARRRLIVAAFQSATTDPDAARSVAQCLTDGCGGLVPRAPANACLFWTLYINSRPGQVGAVDRASRQSSCAGARFGSESRRDGVIRLWSRTAKAG